METTAKFVNLSDGRKLAYAEYGDPKGKPLFFFHGWPSSRFQGETLHRAASKLHIRVIAPDRPGMGQSDFKQNRTLLDWAQDISELSDHLKIQMFSILGNSGGAPYVAACCFQMPQRIHHAGICVGLGPTDSAGVFEGMGPLNRISWEIFVKYPQLQKVSSFLMFLRSKAAPILVHLLQHDKATQNLRQSIIRNRAEAFRKGIQGPAHELELYSHEWGFDVHQISVPLKLWYGDNDKNVSLEMGKWYSKHLKNSHLHIYKGEDHFLLRRHTDEILKVL